MRGQRGYRELESQSYIELVNMNYDSTFVRNVSVQKPDIETTPTSGPEPIPPADMGHKLTLPSRAAMSRHGLPR